MSDPTPVLIDALYREEVAHARAMSIEEKLRAGGELFDEVCERMRAGIRSQFPDADGENVEQILRRRLDIIRHLEQVL
ncbi:MAG: hypothetical protein KAY37_04940 [Phycisphaerae bacterium]|nr:hypothetical protein [Phycisphaerae bacterium]